MQTTDTIFMVRPAAFSFNRQTATNNHFQQDIDKKAIDIQEAVGREFDAAVQVLQSIGLRVLVFDDSLIPEKPDAIFPNNWVSIRNNCLISYPMFSENRRHERNPQIIESLKQKFNLEHSYDLSFFEQQNRYLEGTGSVVFDHIHQKAYACLSERTHAVVLDQLCQFLNYEAVTFSAKDSQGMPIYHTNVMLSIAPDFVVICLESIHNKTERTKITAHFEATGHKIIPISLPQVYEFAGNMLCVHQATQKYLLMSQRAADSLAPTQKNQLEAHASIVALNIPTIETIGGGSARCMLAEIFY